MELYTYRLNNSTPTTPGTFDIQDIIEKFESLIWTERYYGDSEAQIILPIEMELIEKLPLDIFIGINESDEPLMIDTINIEDNRLKVNAISILTWLNNRFIRYSKKHKKQTKRFKNWPPGQLVWEILYDMTNPNSEILNPDSIGIEADYITKLPIPEIGLFNFDSSGDPITLDVSYGPLYDGIKDIAIANQIGMQIILQTKRNPDAEKPLGFRSYRGLNKTRAQDPDGPQNPIVRFSQDLNTLQNLRQVMSKSIYKTIVFAFAPNLEFELSSLTDPMSGVAYLEDTGDPNTFTGFNCRASQIFSDTDEFPTEGIPTDAEIEEVFDALNNEAKNELEQSFLIEAVDGDIVSNNMFQYGRDYILGDIVEVEGINGVISAIRVTEHIISEEASGEKGYVTTGSLSEDVIA